MNKEAFVYRWVNLTNGKFYIGYHKGSLDDGYISSSHSKLFWDDFNKSEMIWEREILFIGSKNDCLFEEQKILKGYDLKDSKLYNNARGSQIIFTDDVVSKMSDSGKKRWENMSEESKKNRNKKISISKTGVKRPIIVSEKLSKLFKGKTFIERYGEERAKEIGGKISKSNTGKNYHTDEWKNTLSEKMIGNDFGQYQTNETREIKRNKFLINNPGKNKTEETRKKISESKKGIPSLTKGVPRKKVTCPYCNKEGGEGLMHRWHFENCKNK
jgi:hypothetical protein